MAFLHLAFVKNHVHHCKPSALGTDRRKAAFNPCAADVHEPRKGHAGVGPFQRNAAAPVGQALP